MKVAAEVSSDKLRGGYYTPDSVVDLCLERAWKLLKSQSEIAILEPSAGDGAFVRGVARFPQKSQVSMACVEKCQSEARKCVQAASKAGIDCKVSSMSFFDWISRSKEEFNCVLGNPPFVRYQFVPPKDREAAERNLLELGVSLQGVSNLFIPFVLLSLRRLQPGGAFAMVLPSEVLCTSSGQQVRAALLAELSDLQVDLFPRDSFPDILQDVIVFSGRKRRTPVEEGRVRFVEHLKAKKKQWSHWINLDDSKWTQFLLDSVALSALKEAGTLLGVHRLGEVAKFTVSIVTGANKFFAVNHSTVAAHKLDKWVKPLMARSFDSPGVIFRNADHEEAVSQGRPAWLLDFDSDMPNPESYKGASTYLKEGETEGLPERYKCRIRSPWYRVPHVWAGDLMMSKRASLHHRVILNEASVLTTDTVYRGKMLPEYMSRKRDLVAGFHNSLTLLSAEIEGRNYGGGVLELVPSEISRLLVPLLPTNGALDKLDQLSRVVGGQRDPEELLVHETNKILGKTLKGYSDLVEPLEQARQRLRRRRFDL